MKNLRRFGVLFLMLVMALTLTSCRKPFDTPEFVELNPTEIGFLIPMTADGGDATIKFASEDSLEKTIVSAQRVQIPHTFIQTGRKEWMGEWKPAARLIAVDTQPITKSWNSAGASEGTSDKNEAIYAETADSLGYSIGVNCTAQVSPQRAAKFLTHFMSGSLSQVMDTTIRNDVESAYVAEAAKYTLEETLKNKAAIMKVVYDAVAPKYDEMGIDILSLGMKDGIEYDNPDIQKAIDARSKAERDAETQKLKNQTAIEQAEAEAKVMLKKAEAEAKANELLSKSLTPEIVEMERIRKWDGSEATTVVHGSSDASVEVKTSK